MKYFSTFVSGMNDIAVDILKKIINDVRIIKIFDGAVLYETGAPFESNRLLCFNNSFAVLDFFYDNSTNSVEKLMKKEISTKPHPNMLAAMQSNSKKQRNFRIVTSDENNLIAVDAVLRSKTEQFIRSYSHLQLNRSKSDTEFWFLRRSEGITLFLKRLTKSREQVKGSLHQELSYMLNYLAEPKKSDIFLDAFCGNGSIAKARASYFKARKIYAIDNDKFLIQSLIKSYIKNSTSIEFQNIDIRLLENNFPDGSIDKIIADPPWGLFIKEDVKALYIEMMNQFQKVLRSGGVLIVLTACKEDFRKLIGNSSHFILVNECSILVSGKKAGVYKLRRK